MDEHLRGMTSLNEIGVPINGSVPYHYQDTEEERARATAEIIENPYPITDAGLVRGKDLFIINCAICHGEKAMVSDILLMIPKIKGQISCGTGQFHSGCFLLLPATDVITMLLCMEGT